MAFKIISEERNIAPNICLRIYENGTVKYRVTIRSKGKRFSISFDNEQEAREWLQNNYYEYFKDPQKFINSKRKKWI